MLQPHGVISWGLAGSEKREVKKDEKKRKKEPRELPFPRSPLRVTRQSPERKPRRLCTSHIYNGNVTVGIQPHQPPLPMHARVCHNPRKSPDRYSAIWLGCLKMAAVAPKFGSVLSSHTREDPPPSSWYQETQTRGEGF